MLRLFRPGMMKVSLSKYTAYTKEQNQESLFKTL